MALPRYLTTEEYFKETPTVQPRELAHGRLCVAEYAPRPVHQWILAELFMAMTRHVKRHKLGTVWLAPLDVVLDESRCLVVQPDLFFIANGRIAMPHRIEVAPDLIVQILCPHPRIGDLDAHLEWFRVYGVREVWLVHFCRRETEVLEFADGASRRRTCAWGSAIASTVLPHFRPRLSRILRDA